MKTMTALYKMILITLIAGMTNSSLQAQEVYLLAGNKVWLNGEKILHTTYPPDDERDIFISKSFHVDEQFIYVIGFIENFFSSSPPTGILQVYNKETLLKESQIELPLANMFDLTLNNNTIYICGATLNLRDEPTIWTVDLQTQEVNVLVHLAGGENSASFTDIAVSDGKIYTGGKTRFLGAYVPLSKIFDLTGMDLKKDLTSLCDLSGTYVEKGISIYARGSDYYVVMSAPKEDPNSHPPYSFLYKNGELIDTIDIKYPTDMYVSGDDMCITGAGVYYWLNGIVSSQASSSAAFSSVANAVDGHNGTLYFGGSYLDADGIGEGDATFQTAYWRNAELQAIDDPGITENVDESYYYGIRYDGTTSRSYALNKIFIYDNKTESHESQLKSSIEVFPNPVNDKLMIRSSAKMEHIELLTLSGQKVMEKFSGEQQTNMNISTLTAGVYLLRTTTTESTDISKIIKQ